MNILTLIKGNIQVFSNIFRHAVLSLLLSVAACSDDYVAGTLYPTTDPYFLNYDKSSLTFDSREGSLLLLIQSYNTPWSISNSSSWIKLSASEGTGSTSIQVTVDENKEYSTSSRVGVLTLSSSNGKHRIERHLTVTQDAPSAYLEVDQSSVVMKGSLSETSVSVSCNTAWECRISGGTWLTASQSDGGVVLRAEENTGNESRYAVLTVSSPAATRTVDVVQHPAVLELSADTIEFEYAGGTSQFSFASESAWSAATADSWISVSPSSGNAGSNSVSVTVAANNTSLERTGSIRINNKQVSIRQSGLELSPSKTSFQFNENGESLELQISSNTSWTLTPNMTADWLHIDKNSGTGSSVVTLTAEQNFGYPRNVILRLQHSETLYFDISIAQGGGGMDIINSLDAFPSSGSSVTFDHMHVYAWKATVESGIDWIHATSLGSSNADPFIINVDENYGYKPRESYIDLTYENDRRYRIMIVQEGKPFEPYVDLGLSAKWASCNVGASSPVDVGTFFAWGETASKTNYDWSTYRYCSGSANSLLKYNDDADFGNVDNRSRILSIDDAATSVAGSEWRMPTLEEFYELSTMCTHKWITIDGVQGVQITGPNGNSIFLPAAGYMSGPSLVDSTTDGWYWTSDSASACHFSESVALFNYNINWMRCYGFCVRAVSR